MRVVNNSSVQFVDKLGTDLTIVNAARVSFDKQHEYFDASDEKLVNYLAQHKHWSPFAHAQLQLRMSTPIFVARQLVKHQVGLVWNEVSRRYVSDEPEFYMPEVWRGKPAEGAKQGSFGELVLPMNVENVLDESLNSLAVMYDDLLAYGVAPEQARMILPQNMMTSWYWTGSLYAFARVCRERLDPHAQKETRDVAVLIDAICEEHFPFAWKALRDAK